MLPFPLHVFVGRLHGLGGEAHVLEDLCVGVGVLQGLPLELDGGQGAVDLGQLLLITLLPFQRLQGGWIKERGRETERSAYGGHAIIDSRK